VPHLEAHERRWGEGEKKRFLSHRKKKKGEKKKVGGRRGGPLRGGKKEGRKASDHLYDRKKGKGEQRERTYTLLEKGVPALRQ